MVSDWTRHLESLRVWVGVGEAYCWLETVRGDHAIAAGFVAVFSTTLKTMDTIRSEYEPATNLSDHHAHDAFDRVLSGQSVVNN